MENVTLTLEHNHIFGMIIGTTAIFGIFTNITAMWILYFGGKINCGFQQLCFSHCFSNFMDEMFFLFYCAPAAFFELTDWTKGSTIARLIGGWMVFQWNISVYSHLMVSINRVIVLTWPVKSRTFLTQKVSAMMIAIVWIFSFVNFVPYLFVNTCYFEFNIDLYLFLFSDNFCGTVIGQAAYLGGTFACYIIITFDMWSMSRLIKYKMSSGSAVNVQDVRFFVQAVLQGMCFINALTNFFLVAPRFAAEGNFVVVFFLNIFIWQTTQAVDGLIIIPFHIGNYRKYNADKRSREVSTNYQSGTAAPQPAISIAQIGSQNVLVPGQTTARNTALVAPATNQTISFPTPLPPIPSTSTSQDMQNLDSDVEAT